MYIILVRHGETDYNKLGIVQGSEVDPPLNEFGKKQANITGDFINKNFNIDVIYSSKYLRAKQTAALIKRKINYTGKVYLNNDLREASKGILSGLEKTQVNELIKSNNKLQNFKDNCDKIDHYQKLDTLYQNDNISKMIKKETNKEVGIRARNIIKKIIKKNLNKNILIISHGSFIANSIRNIFDLRQIPAETLGNGNCSITVFKIANNKKELIMGFNNMHLKELY